MQVVVLAVVLAIASTSVAWAQEGGAALTQVNTALQHVGFSLSQTAVAGALMHLHHVVNCLEGRSGANFDQSKGYPCNNQGNGIVNDVGDGLLKVLAEAADSIAVAGTQYTDLETVHAAGNAVKALLEQIKNEISM